MTHGLADELVGKVDTENLPCARTSIFSVRAMWVARWRTPCR